MIEIICGEKGKGKTKELLEKVNHTVSTVTGSVVYLDKSQKHMYELNNKVRLINVVDYPITNCDEFLWKNPFLSGRLDTKKMGVFSIRSTPIFRKPGSLRAKPLLSPVHIPADPLCF
jgi:hypothetical protein